MKLGPIDFKRREKAETETSDPLKGQGVEEAAAAISASATGIAKMDDISEISADPGVNADSDKIELAVADYAEDESSDSDDGEDEHYGLQDRFSKIKGTTVKTLSPLGRAGKFHLKTFKEEGKDLKKLLSSKEVVIYKTDAVAVLLRRLGGYFEFLEEYNKLVREGYTFAYSEAVESFFEIPVAGIKTKLGKLYYFHHQKYASGSEATIPPDLTKHVNGRAIPTVESSPAGAKEQDTIQQQT
ncbi:MAG: hypothetical protein ABI361_06345 [Nitrososphaera sp.]|jgi:hypothetical protein